MWRSCGIMSVSIVGKKPQISKRASTRDDHNDVPFRPPAGDIAFVCGKDADGVHILRRRSEEAPIEAGLLRPMREGKPIDGEVVSLTQRQDLPMIYDVKSEFGGPQGEMPEAVIPGDRSSADGPAQVASEAYRKGWDAVWGRRRDPSVN
jgi:hypothetical protein